MKISILFATFNRDEILTLSLNGYRKMDFADIDLQIIIVDNACLDSTKELVESYSDLPVQYLQNPKPGKNASLNMGLESVKGDYVILTDDDAIPTQNWMVEYQNAFLKYPDYSVFGGPIAPHVEKWPEWLDKSNVQIQGALVIREAADEDLDVETIFLWGPNMAVKADVFVDGFNFNENIGPNGTDYLMGSETELLARLAVTGYRAMFLKNVLVHHQIRDEQLSLEWLKYRAIRTGKGLAHYKVQHNKYDKQVRKFAGVPRYLLVKFILNCLKLPLDKLFLSPANYTSCFYNLYWRKGELSYLNNASWDK
jgi:glycosyltransferase involved in cell wall biosynthesis